MSRLANAAYDWLLKNAPPEGVTTTALWDGMLEAFPALTAASEDRKTPRNTLIRDMRVDRFDRFDVDRGWVRLLRRDWKSEQPLELTPAPRVKRSRIR
jgi:hypothetical protein